MQYNTPETRGVLHAKNLLTLINIRFFKMTPKQLKLVRVLLFKEGIPHEEENMAIQYTEGRSTDLLDLTHVETQELIKALNGQSPSHAMVNKILSMAHEMRWKLADGKIDMERVNAWCEKYTTSHQPLNKIPKKELPTVVTVFTKMYNEYLKAI